ncbi:MAG TPA: endonuclease/exonuclease/phosphatase family protein [Methylophilaceae bacterium]|jgi:endonuclease/exonuclease/phosphatase family metal-dependent hydrolase|nr:endonuclease/exonuclease/phosphatase family protein [Methylophilaceae bacterium]
MHRQLRIATFNIHKGVTSFNARLVLHEQRELIRHLQADIVFLQEVLGAHTQHKRRFKLWPTESQHEFLADSIWNDYAYGKNAVYPAGHHGNALLSKFPITKWENINISAHSTEQRGMLHCEVRIPGWDQDLHCICVHLGLFARWRRKQLFWLRTRIESVVPPNAPLIIAGDFNDWRMKAGQTLADSLHLREVFEHGYGKPARSFPSVFPLLRLDRIYVRGFHVHNAQVHGGAAFARVSDHAALSATLLPL